MATITSVGSGNWSAAGTWDAGVPVDGDDVVIASGHTVTFDVDQSAFVTGVKVTITGTLTHAVTGGPYTLFIKTGSSIGGTGTWNIGTATARIPFAVKHTITGASGWYVTGASGLTTTIFGAEPTYNTIRLSAAEASGQTDLSIDTDLTGDIWAAGDTIRILTDKAKTYDERTIAAGGITASTITITSGLSAAKTQGCPIHLVTRNVKIIGVGSPAQLFLSFASGKLTIGGGSLYTATYLVKTSADIVISGGFLYGGNQMILTCTGTTFSGGIIHGCSKAFQAGGITTISGGVISACDNAVAGAAQKVIMTGGLITNGNTAINETSYFYMSGGKIDRFINAITCYGGELYGGEISNVTSVLFGASDVSFSNFQFTTCVNLINGSNRINLFNCVFTSITNETTGTLLENSSSIKHNAVDGAIKVWSRGGSVTSQTSVVPTGYTQAYLHALVSAIYPSYWKQAICVPAGETVNVIVQLRKDASMTFLPRCYLVRTLCNPIFLPATAITAFTMTDSVDTWESDTFTVANTTNYDQDYTLWFVAQNATGSAYSAYKITTAGGSGGGRNVPIPVFLHRRNR